MPPEQDTFLNPSNNPSSNDPSSSDHPVDEFLRHALYAFDCPPPEQLADWVFDALPPDVRAEISVHVERCPRCKLEIIEMERFKAATDEPDFGADSAPALRLVPRPEKPRTRLFELYPDLPKAVGDSSSRTRGDDEPRGGLFDDGMLVIPFEHEQITVFLAARQGSGQLFLEGRIADEHLARWVDALVEIRRVPQDDRPASLLATAVVDASGGFICALPGAEPFSFRLTSLPGLALLVERVE